MGRAGVRGEEWRNEAQARTGRVEKWANKEREEWGYSNRPTKIKEKEN